MIKIKAVALDPTGWLEMTWYEHGREIKHTSYHPTQLDMLRKDMLEMGAPLGPLEKLKIDKWQAT